ncbi:MAG: hypothetical protein OXI22_21960, partial [Defluviicoccus sp.]|nr:hypothetical protein [Defluviicoccus sp.]
MRATTVFALSTARGRGAIREPATGEDMAERHVHGGRAAIEAVGLARGRIPGRFGAAVHRPVPRGKWAAGVPFASPRDAEGGGETGLPLLGDGAAGDGLAQPFEQSFQLGLA